MKASTLLPLAALATMAGLPLAHGFAEFARGELMLSTSARALYDSRVFGGQNPADDYIFTLDPRLIYRREAGQIKMEGVLGTRINRYVDFTELNSEDLVASLRLNLPAESPSLASGSFTTSYDEHTDINYDVNRRIREKTFANHAEGLFPLSLKTALLFDGSFRRDQRNQYSDRDSWTASGAFRYQDFLGGSALDLRYRRIDVNSTGGSLWGIPIDQNTDVYSATLSRPLYHDVRGSLTYGYRILRRSMAEAIVTGQRRSEGSIFAVTIDGPFLPESKFPKIESSLTLGYQKSETPGINDNGGTRLFGAGHLAWHARERTRVFLDLRRAQELSVNNLTVETTGANLGVSQSVGNFTALTASAGYEQRDYRSFGRTDDVYVFEVGGTYRIAAAWSATANCRLRSSQSSVSSADYDRHVVYAEITYRF